ncbi:unnamed protein product, partial [Effrenium voratum]
HILPFGLAAVTRRATYRVWLDDWEGVLEEVELREASQAMSELRRIKGRDPDMMYLNCEGCEYEVLQQLVSTGWLSRIPRLAIFWHAGGAPWASRCELDRQLRRSHRMVRAVQSV